MSNVYDISIIVPVYNVEQFLERCVDSLVAQDLDTSEYEIIMVNDGSTDNSRGVAERMVGKYPNVSLLCQKNRGLSGARNTGMGHARGKYIMFVDSDDYLEKNCLKHLVDVCLQNNLDICHFQLTWVSDRSTLRGSIGTLKYDTIYSGSDILRDGSLIGSACSNLYKSAFLKENHLTFYEGITHQDVEFVTRFFCCSPKVMLVDDEVYYYVYNPQSISKSKSFEKENKYVCDSAVIARLAKDYAAQYVEDEEVKDLVERRANSSVIGNLVGLLRKPVRPLPIVENLLQAYCDNGLYPVKGKCLNWKSRLMGLFLSNRKMYLSLYARKRRKYEA